MFYKLFVENFKEAFNNGNNEEIVKLLCNATGKNVRDVSIRVNDKNEFWSVDFCVDGKQYSISVPYAPRDVEMFDFQYVKSDSERHNINAKIYKEIYIYVNGFHFHPRLFFRLYFSTRD